MEFLKLEKIELGGVRGNILGSQVTQIYDEVFELVKVFADCKYDPLDPGDSVSRGPWQDRWQMPREWEGTQREHAWQRKDGAKDLPRDFPGGPVVRTLCCQHRGRGFNPWWGN